MTPGYQSRLAPKIFHFHVKYHVTTDVLVSSRDHLVLLEELERNSYGVYRIVPLPTYVWGLFYKMLCLRLAVASPSHLIRRSAHQLLFLKYRVGRNPAGDNTRNSYGARACTLRRYNRVSVSRAPTRRRGTFPSNRATVPALIPG